MIKGIFGLIKSFFKGVWWILKKIYYYLKLYVVKNKNVFTENYADHSHRKKIFAKMRDSTNGNEYL